MTDKQYAVRDSMALDDAGGHYFRHVMAMTAENLHSKGDIAAELGYRDMQIAALQEQVQKLAAENSRYSAIAADLVCLPDEDINGITKSVRNILNRIVLNSVSPATDAFICEIGAKAVEGFEKYCLHLAECSGDKRWIGCSRNAALYANTIRAGEQP